MDSVGDLNTQVDIGEIPPELASTPSPCVAFVGLDLNNKRNAYTWSGFTTNRQPERPPITYRLLECATSLAPCKPKKSSYEWHIPKGILKSNWLNKHLFEIPSVAVLFFDLDWSDPKWETMLALCAEKVEQLKSQLSGRSTRLAVVLVQDNMTPAGDDFLATERASVFCNTCDLSPKSLFVLPIGDVQNFFGYILRMENAFFEMAKSYYQHEIKIIKNHKDQLNKTTHSLLFVRHMFKVAFFSEMRQDVANAVKNYKQAYAYLMEIRVSSTNLFEIKTIAGLINYKICKLLFSQNDPIDAISQFRKHIDIFKNKSEPKEIEFEHAAWLSKQFIILGDLFDQAITSGLVPSQTQHPGYYYHEAALQAIRRKKLARKVSTEVLVSEDRYTEILSSFSATEFYGQRPWRPGCQSLEPLDIEREKEGLAVLLYKEQRFFNHTSSIITILSSAVTQFKKHKCPRMTRYMMVLMAEEYYADSDYVNTLVFLNQVMPFYRLEHWKSILVSLLTTALYSAYYSINVAEFIKLSLEFISSWNTKSYEERAVVQESLGNVLKLEPPLAFGLHDSDRVLPAWREALNLKEEEAVAVNMNSAVPFIELKPLFHASTVFVDEEVTISVYLKTNCPSAIHFNNAVLTLSQPYYDQFCVLNTETLARGILKRLESSTVVKVDEMCFYPGKTYLLEFRFKLLAEDALKQLEIASFSLYLGKHPLAVILRWSFQTSSDEAIAPPPNWNLQKATTNKDTFTQVIPLYSIGILNRPANISFEVEHSAPALLNESYALNVKLVNLEAKTIANVRLTIERLNKIGGVVEKIICEGVEVDENEVIHVSENFACNETLSKLVLLPSLTIGTHNFRLTVMYDAYSSNATEQMQSCVCSKSLDVDFEVVFPFSCTFTMLNARGNQVTAVRALEPFIMKVLTKSLSCHKVSIESFHIQINPASSTTFDVTTDEANEGRKPAKQILNFDENVEVQYILNCTQAVSAPTSLGSIVVKWRRDDSSAVNETTLMLPEVAVERSILYVEAVLPPYGVTRQHLQLTCVIHNRTDEILPLELSMENSDNFMYSGNKQVKLDIQPRSSLNQYYILYPLVCGYVSLPKLRLVSYPDTSSATPMDQLLEELMPAFLQIMPQEKKLLNQAEEILVTH